MSIDKKNVQKPKKIDDNLSKNYDIGIEMIPKSYRKKNEKYTEAEIKLDTSFFNSLISPKNKRLNVYNVRNILDTYNVIIKIKPINKYLTMDDGVTVKFPSYKIEIAELPLDYIEQIFVYDKKRNYEKLIVRNEFNLDNLRNYIYNYIVDTSKILDSQILFNKITDKIINILSKNNLRYNYSYYDTDDDPDTIIGNHTKSNYNVINEILTDKDNNTLKELLLDYLD